jgi:hypothetical protein
MEKPRIFTTGFSTVYPFYIQKAEKSDMLKKMLMPSVVAHRI